VFLAIAMPKKISIKINKIVSIQGIMQGDLQLLAPNVCISPFSCTLMRLNVKKWQELLENRQGYLEGDL